MKLTDEQLKSYTLNELLECARHQWSCIFTATTKEEQRKIARYIQKECQKEGINYQIVDLSKKEESIITGGHFPDCSLKIVINLQDLFLAPYCANDEETTVTQDSKLEFYTKHYKGEVIRTIYGKRLEQIYYDDVSMNNECNMLEALNFIRDSYFYGKGRKTIFGCSPLFLAKIKKNPYNPHIADLLDYIQLYIKFNKDPDFELSPSETSDYFKPQLDSQGSSTRISGNDIICVNSNKQIVRVPNSTNIETSYVSEKELLSYIDKNGIPIDFENFNQIPNMNNSKMKK